MTNSRQTAARKPAKAASGSRRSAAPAVHGREAATRAQRQDNIAIQVPFLGRVKLPRPEETAYYAGIGLLTAVELLEWPAAVALAVGHALIGQQQHKQLREFGEALEDA